MTMPPPPPYQSFHAQQPQPPARPWWKRKRVIIPAAAIVAGIVIGSTSGTATPAPAYPAAAPGVAASAAPAPQPAPAPAPAGPLTTFDDGTYVVGEDIAPGRYKTPGPASSDILDSCYMEVSDGTGTISGIDQNDNLTGPGVVTLKAGKYFTARGGCTWSKA